MHTQNSLLPNYFITFFYFLCSYTYVYYICMAVIFSAVILNIFSQIHIQRCLIGSLKSVTIAA